MRRRRAAAAAALAVLSLRPATRAGAWGAPRVDDATYHAAETAWQRCFSQSARAPAFPERPEPGDWSAKTDVQRTPRGFRITRGDWGNGVESGYGELTIDFEPDGCRALWSDEGGMDGGLGNNVEAGWVNRGPPIEAEVRDLIAEPARADDARDAFARAWLGHRCPGGPNSNLSWDHAIEGPIASAQPAHDGPPRRAPRTFWSTTSLDAIGASGAMRRFDFDAEDDDGDGDDKDDDNGLGTSRPGKDAQLAGVSIPPIGRPVPTFATRRYQLFEATIPGRNEGKAIAVMDRAANRHRWAVVTRGCVQGTTVTWLGAIGDRIVGVTNSRHGRYAEGDAILIIDGPTATAWAVPLPENIREQHRDSDAKVHASLSRSILSLRAARAKAKIDLAPLLAQIPAR